MYITGTTRPGPVTFGFPGHTTSDMHRSQLLLHLLLLPFTTIAQGTWDIKDPGGARAEKCGECLATLANRPKEIQFGLFADENNDVWFVLNYPRFFDQLFKKGGDGIAVDVVPRSMYACGDAPPVQRSFHKGELLKPVYLSDLKRIRKDSDMGSAWKVGRLPASLAKEDVELNLVILRDRNVCYYNSFYDLARYRWDLLNMGLYMDTLTYASTTDTTRAGAARTILRRKALHFTIPFEKNKSEYSPADLKPLYDSLRLTDFTIKRIDIEAFSSVEGAEARNIELQEKRAQSIVNALQTFQKPGIQTTVKASENWVEFLRDVLLTSNADLAGLTKPEIKKRLQDKHTAEQLEPILAHHRKALVTLELTRKDGLAGLSEEQIIRQFEQAVADKNLARARDLQNTVMERIMDEELPMAFLDRLEVPEQREFAGLTNSRIAFRYFEDPRDALASYNALLELKRLLPGDAHINYNLCAIRFRVWLQGGAITVDPGQFKRDIEALRGMGIDEPLVKRMLVNHHIIMAELYMAQGDFAQKDESMKYIFRNYKSIPMSTRDHLSLAQYFASYANYDKAIDVVEPLVGTVDADEDLLFYYLNLTIIDPKKTSTAPYRGILLNAIAKNRPRYCGMFDTFGKGITFQLLDDPVLFKTFCENCKP